MISPTPPNPSAPKTVAQVLGEIVWLLSQSPAHRQLFISDLEWFCMPAILLEQFRMFHGADRRKRSFFCAYQDGAIGI